jgi:hypothetical protein
MDKSNDSVHDDEVVPRKQQFFWFPTDTVTKEHSYNCNDGGECDTFYFAAVLIISPWSVA